MTDEQFEQMVSAGVEAIPERFLKQLDNVAVVIADRPTREQLRQQGLHPDDTAELLGLYEGTPATARGEYYGIGDMSLPDKITIFKEGVLLEARILQEKGTEKDFEEIVREVVRDTVWHEVGHYVGWDDEELYEREDEGTNFSGPRVWAQDAEPFYMED